MYYEDEIYEEIEKEIDEEISITRPWHKYTKEQAYDTFWWSYGNILNKIGDIEKENINNISAIIVFQDCNLSSQYYRYFWWKKNTNDFLFQVTHINIFNEPLEKINDLYVLEGCFFEVKNLYDNEYIKLFERI